MMGKGREIPLAAPLTGKGREMRVVVVLWRAGWVSKEASEKVWGWFEDVGDGDRGGKNLQGPRSEERLTQAWPLEH